MSKVAFIIVTYNGEAYIEKCILSIKNFCKDSYILVIDNDSKDKTRSILKSLPINDIILSGENIGFGKANNIGIKKAIKAGYRFIFLANQDLYFYKGNFDLFLKTSIIAFENKKFGVISPLQLAPDEDQFDFKFFDYISNKNTPGLLQHLEKKNDEVNVFRSKAINAAAWLISTECIQKVGVFDPIFPHYGEDTDYIKRMFYHGYRIGVIPNLKVVHNRKQKEFFTLNKKINSLKIWSLSYFKNINKSILHLFLRFPFLLTERVKSIEIGIFRKILTYSIILIYSLSKIIAIFRSRKISKTNGAFL